MNINIVKTHPSAQIPQYATSGAACFDLSCIDGGTVAHGSCLTFDTGLQFEVPEGYVMMIYSRSGHGFKHGVRLVNAVGVVDSDYRGNTMVKLHNDSTQPFTVAAGDRIAQAMIIPVFTVGFTVCEQLSDTVRGTGGFGSTGTAATRLKVGQRVRLSPAYKHAGKLGNPLDTDGIVQRVDDGVILVEWDGKYRSLYLTTDNSLTLVSQ